jgi:hypothetical protein
MTITATFDPRLTFTFTGNRLPKIASSSTRDKGTARPTTKQYNGHGRPKHAAQGYSR